MDIEWKRNGELSFGFKIGKTSDSDYSSIIINEELKLTWKMSKQLQDILLKRNDPKHLSKVEFK